MAASTTTYTTFNGLLMSEDRDGVETFYTPDPIGNLAEGRNSSGTKTFEAQYWPYGEMQTSTGTNPSPWGFVGLLGYLSDLSSTIYVRARFLMTKTSKWLTVDLLWPDEAAYQYVDCAPSTVVDPDGLKSFVECPACWWIDWRHKHFDGEDTTDPNGNPVRIGGWPATFNRHNNGLTIQGTVHFTDWDTYHKYEDDQRWQDHEEGHIADGMNMLRLPEYGLCALIGLVSRKPGDPSGHDTNPMEMEANKYADRMKVLREPGVMPPRPRPIVPSGAPIFDSGYHGGASSPNYRVP